MTKNIQTAGRLTFVLRVLLQAEPSEDDSRRCVGSVQCLESGERADIADDQALLRFLENELRRASEEAK
ncbi:MAG: hypothetical protein AAFR88_05955 [Pseudomonadota bacterium]